MKKEIKILLVGDAYSVHLLKFVGNLKKLNPNLKIDIFNISKSNKNEPEKIAIFNRVIQPRKYFPNWIYKISFLLPFFSRFLDLGLSFASSFCHSKYDIINIHFVSVESFFLMPQYKRKAKTIMSSPWGSDIYRNKGLYKFMVKKIMDWSDWISAPKIQFREDIKKIFQVAESKFVDLGFGADMIDVIRQNEWLSRDEAKAKIGLIDNYLITCGYNGLKPQRHAKIINALAEVRESLPENLHLLLPMTYGASKNYIEEIRNLLKKHHFDYTIYDQYLPDDKLLYIRKASDMFIHAQPTDAFSASMQEYLLCETIVVNGHWTRYPDLEKFGIPYYLYHSFDELPACILKAYRQEENIHISNELKEFIRKKGWQHLAKEWSKVYEEFAR
ncbi:MAG: glycosyltransferase family 4 protein [Bacteroidales bacterium]|nr:glycosyltransferase family 4 protein [Bacteroidales bacterium]